MLSDGQPTDQLFGSFDAIDTTITINADGTFTAEALGQKATSEYQHIAIDILNHILDEKIQKGELNPQG